MIRPHPFDSELVNLFHTARTALCDKPVSEQSRWHRMLWAASWFHREHPEFSETRAYKELSRMLDNGAYKPRWVL